MSLWPARRSMQAPHCAPPKGDGACVVRNPDPGYGMNPVSRWFGLMFDRRISGDDAQRLAKLKGVSERAPAP
jgi:hypothetical protein